MERDLAERSFCYGTRFSLADIAAGYALAYLDSALPDFEWRSGHPKLVALAQRLGTRESFRKTVPQA
jgi:glutathione S-transferase